MTTKLTLAIEEKVIHSAKNMLKKRAKASLILVANYLKSIVTKESPEEALSPKVVKLMGSVKLPSNFDYKKEIGKAVSKKYK